MSESFIGDLMAVPTEAWHREVLDKSDLELLENEFSAWEEHVTEFVETYCQKGIMPGQTPENLAYLIGEFAYSNLREDDYFIEVVDQGVDGREGEKMAKSYIGIQAMKSSDV